MSEIVLHPAGGPPGSPLARLLAREPQLMAAFAPLVGPVDPPPYALSGPRELLADAGAGLPEGPATAEAVAVRLRRRGIAQVVGAPIPLTGAQLLAWHARRGRHAMAILRADPGLLREVQAGSWFNATAEARLVRHALGRLEPRIMARALGRARSGRSVRALCDASFWAGLAAAAAPGEHGRLTRGYTALIYHRLAGEMKPGQESLDLPPAHFRRQMRALRLLGFRPLPLQSIVALHEHGIAPPRRAVLVTADDAFADCAAEFGRHGALRPVLFVPTAETGGQAAWAGGERVAGWDELDALSARGIALGAHTRHHVRLTGAPEHVLAEEVGGSMADLATHDSGGPLAFAYPHGAHDDPARRAVRDAGAVLAFTTEIGRNGAGTDPWCLRRIGIKAWDTLPAFVFKAATGQHLPGPWDRRLRAGWTSRPR